MITILYYPCCDSIHLLKVLDLFKQNLNKFFENIEYARGGNPKPLVWKLFEVGCTEFIVFTKHQEFNPICWLAENRNNCHIWNHDVYGECESNWHWPWNIGVTSTWANVNQIDIDREILESLPQDDAVEMLDVEMEL